MAVMAWDHVSGFWNEFHHGGEGILGQAPPFLNLTWFLERFVSHVCAPSFIFLAGTVLALSVARRLERGESQRGVTSHIIVRGVVLLLLEAVIVAPAFDLPQIYFGVLACIGICLIVFSVYRRLPSALILAISLIIILNHSFLDLGWIPNDTPLGWYARVVIHEPNFDWWPYVGLYPIIPWIGVMGLGWGFGSLLATYDLERIRKLKVPLFAVGGASLALFFVVRWLNGYGNLLQRQGNTVIDWLYVSKYPPSIAFLLWSLGLMSILLAVGLVLQERGSSDGGLSDVIHTYGRTPLFFYLTHLWLYKMRLPYTPKTFFLPMWQTFIFWLVGLVVLWLLCKWYNGVKSAHPGSLLRYI